MIVVSKLNHEKFAVNPDLIQRIDSAPDTILTLVDGTKYIVSESMPEVIELIDVHRAEIIARAQQAVCAEPDNTAGHLSLVHDDTGEN
ncbi:flagellar FlbD family protein [Timonella sp. A28]|uniref:flagellar FlbD family protein n=1 Tax=Timonella sp. A28 TaxID=3442640 RepID=UPI003EBBD536